MKIISIPNQLDQAKLKEIAGTILNGSVIAYPTDTLYGLGGNAFNETVIQRIFELKNRKKSKPMLILVSNGDMISSLVRDIPFHANKIIQHLCPASLTMLFEASPKISRLLHANTGKIGIRIPNHNWVCAIIQETKVPLISTSANLSGEGKSPVSVENIVDVFPKGIDLIVDGGQAQSNQPSTVLDVTVSPPVILREGTVTKSQIETIIGEVIIK